MDREQEIGLLKARQARINDDSADRASLALREYWPREDTKSLMGAATHLLVDVCHLAHREQEAFALAELLPAVHRLFEAELLRADRKHLERIEPPPEGG